MGKTLWHLIQRARHDGCTGLAAMIAYNFFLALPAFLIFMVTVLAYLPIENLDTQIIDQLRGLLPSDVLSILSRVLERSLSRERTIWLLPLSLLGTLYVMNNGYAGLIGSLNRIYDLDETRPWLRVRLRALVMSSIAGAFLLAAFTLLLVAPRIVSALSDDQGFNMTAGLWLGRLRWPMIVALAVIGMETTYRFAPCVTGRVKWHIVSPGTIFAASAWLVATLAFGYYVNNFGSYENIYGSLGSVIVLLTWMWISAMMFLTGGEINMMWRLWRESPLKHPERATVGAPDV